MRKYILVYLALFSINSATAQIQDIEDGPTGYDQIDAPQLFEGNTERNFPDEGYLVFKIIPCRKEAPKPVYFPRVYRGQWKDYQDPLNLSFDKLSYNDKIHLYELITDTKDTKYLELLIKLIKYDTIKQDIEIRENLVKCLGEYNTDKSKKTLLSLLKNESKALSTIAAINLIKLDCFDEAINYFENSYDNDYYVELVYSSLMFVNSKQSIKLLKSLAQRQAAPVLSIDAYAALSLLGNCDFAFNQFKSLAKNESEAVRIKVVSCLAYYIGTEEAFQVIKEMQNDESENVNNEIRHVLSIFNNQK